MATLQGEAVDFTPAPAVSVEQRAEVIGDYEILGKLGQGGMGAVYRARQISLDRVVALKILPADLEEDETYVARFQREAAVAAGLNHPNLVHVYASGYSDGSHFIAMELVEGDNLRQRMKRGDVPMAEAVRICLEVARGLQFAWHRAQLIHRDVKPSNIYLSGEGQVKLGDLGLAKSLLSNSTHLTHTGTAIGTPHYISPEQAKGERTIDLRADIYSLGCTVYHLLTGSTPYHASDPASVIYMHINAPPPAILKVLPQCPMAVGRLVNKMLRKGKHERHQTYEELIAAMEGALEQLEHGVTAAGPSAVVAAWKEIGAAEQRGGLLLSPAATPASSPQTGPAKTSLASRARRRTALAFSMVAGVGVLVTAAFLLWNRAPAPATPPRSAVPQGDPSAAAKPVVKEAWHDYLAELRQKGALQKLSGVTDDGVLVRALDTARFWLSDRHLGRNGAVRVVWRVPPEVRPEQPASVVIGKILDANGASNGAYNLSIGSKIALGNGTKDHPFRFLGQWDYPPGFDRNLEHTWELRIVGDLFTVRVDEQEIGSVHDHALEKSGNGEVVMPEGVTLRSLETLNLDAVPTVAASTPATATKGAPFTNSLGMKFVPVPITGGPTDKQRVLFSIWETRVQDYEAFVNETKHEWPREGSADQPTYPAGNTSWEDAQAFCRWLTERERQAGRIGPAERYRLPTSHEWSCAVGIGEREDGDKAPFEKTGKLPDVYPWGTQWPPPPGAGNYKGEENEGPVAPQTQAPIAGYRDPFKGSAPVGSFPPNAFGLYDMGGNVWEKCEDLFEPGRPDHVVRGQSYHDADRDRLLASYIGHAPPGLRYGNQGFRVVLAPAEHVSPATATKDAPFTNSLAMQFVPVPIGGGATKGERVLVGVWDVRVQDYAAYAAANPQADGTWKSQQKDGVPAGREPDHPVVGMSWEDAQAFCQWLTAKEIAEGKLPQGMKYRLPSDEEWSWAVGLPPEQGATPAEKSGKNSVDFPWGKDWPPTKQVGNYADEAFHAKFPLKEETKNVWDKNRWIEGYRDGYATTSPVAAFPGNEYGLHDMGGNVFEWCEDWFDAAHKDRVLRGAGWNVSDRRYLLSSSRMFNLPGHRGVYDGFRCVLAASSPASSTVSAAPSPASATKDAPFTNSLGMKFVPVPITGGPTDKQRVLFSIWETRVQDYEAFVGETKRVWKKPPYPQESTHPAVNMTWQDAKDFCAWLTERERKDGKLGANQRYRLPSDHEWSCAVGIGEQEDATKAPEEKNRKLSNVYPWGDVWPPPVGAGNYSGVEAAGREVWKGQKTLTGYRDDFPTTAPVGSFSANRFGLYDLGGNAEEWCEDLARGPEPESRFERGASFANHESGSLLSSYRAPLPPGVPGVARGFRVVLASEAPVASPTPATATQDAPFTNSLGMRFVPVPITGGPTGGQRVLFSIWETRVQDYETYATEVKSLWRQRPGTPGADHPVTYVVWDEAQGFCRWLTDREHKAGRIGATERYRLPSDHEWSCAVGIGEQEDAARTPEEKNGKLADTFPWGSAWPPPPGAGNFSGEETAGLPSAKGQSVLAGYRDGFTATAPVGSFTANRFGLFDLEGNAREWCEDWFDARHERRVGRGSSFDHGDRGNLLASCRSADLPTGRYPFYGFRVVLAPAQP